DPHDSPALEPLDRLADDRTADCEPLHQRPLSRYPCPQRELTGDDHLLELRLDLLREAQWLRWGQHVVWGESRFIWWQTPRLRQQRTGNPPSSATRWILRK